MTKAKTPTIGFDLSDLLPTTDVVVVTLKHPATGDDLLKADGTAMTIAVYAPHSEAHKAVVHEQVNKRIQKSAKANSKKLTVTSEEIEQNAIEFVAKITKDWDIVLGGSKPALSVAKAVEIYTKFPWIRSQIEEGLNDLAVFTKG